MGVIRFSSITGFFLNRKRVTCRPTARLLSCQNLPQVGGDIDPRQRSLIEPAVSAVETKFFLAIALTCLKAAKVKRW